MDRLIQCDAFRTILLALKDGPAELGPAITGMLLVLSNSPETRQRMVPGSDVEVRARGLRVLIVTACPGGVDGRIRRIVQELDKTGGEATGDCQEYRHDDELLARRVAATLAGHLS